MSANGSSERPTTVRRGLPRRPVGAESTPDLVVASETAPPSGPDLQSEVAAPAAPAAAHSGKRTGLPRAGSKSHNASPADASAPADVSPSAAPAAMASGTTTAPPTGRRAGLPRMGAGPDVVKAGDGGVPAAQSLPEKPAASPMQAARVESPVPTQPAVPEGRFSPKKWPLIICLGVLGLLAVVAVVVLATRWFVSLDFMHDFLATYPGKTHLPTGAPEGLPPWLGWQHFLNAFFIVLIIKTGWQVRTQKRPPATWIRNNEGLVKTKNPPKKISLTLWAHLSFDAVWVINGIVFIIVLFATGQWMRVVPTSWDVIPNAVSAALQYLSLNWPIEDGWVNYNSLQLIPRTSSLSLSQHHWRPSQAFACQGLGQSVHSGSTRFTRWSGPGQSTSPSCFTLCCSWSRT